MRLYLIRHTAPALSAGVCYGQADVEVAATFPEEVEAVRAKMAGLMPAAVYSSPLSRASRLAGGLGLGLAQQDARLMELHFGDWELRRWQDIPREQLDRWGQAYVHEAPPGGETFAGLHARATAFLEEVAVRHLGQDVVVVTHAGVIRALLAEALGLPLAEVFRFQLDYGSVTQIRLETGPPAVGYVNR